MAEGEKNYQEIIREIGKEKFENRLRILLQTIDAFLKEGNFSKEIQCNERILYHVILDYFSDIFRLKEFHDIKHTMTVKNISYLMYWFLKRKPIQMNPECKTEMDIFINERFACYMIVNECLFKNAGNKQVSLDKAGTEKFERYVELMLYYFKYRQVNPQVIELMIESFHMGTYFYMDERK